MLVLSGSKLSETSIVLHSQKEKVIWNMYSFKFILFCWEIYATDKKFLNLNPTNSIQSDLNKLLKMLK